MKFPVFLMGEGTARSITPELVAIVAGMGSWQQQADPDISSCHISWVHGSKLPTFRFVPVSAPQRGQWKIPAGACKAHWSQMTGD